MKINKTSEFYLHKLHIAALHWSKIFYWDKRRSRPMNPLFRCRPGDIRWATFDFCATCNWLKWLENNRKKNRQGFENETRIDGTRWIMDPCIRDEITSNKKRKMIYSFELIFYKWILVSYFNATTLYTNSFYLAKYKIVTNRD